MATSFILSLIAGLLAVNAEPLVKRGLRWIDHDMKLDSDELRVLTFGAALLVAAMLTAIMSADSSAYLAVSGGLLGYFGRVFVTHFLTARDTDPGDQPWDTPVTNQDPAPSDTLLDVPPAAAATVTSGSPPEHSEPAPRQTSGAEDRQRRVAMNMRDLDSDRSSEQ